ncbi:MAG: hypothetical protein HYT80_08935, partial [Euryarchaeota archaeon]|nr:hypothetical protein [Euryarchaeota archaeon]
MTSTDQDSDLKRRFHRLLWYQGFFVRREIAISTHMVGSGHQLQRRDVTDIDVLGVRFSEGLGRETVLTECKSGRNFNGLDGTLKLAGLMQLLGAARSYLVVDRPENLAKRVAPRLGIQVIDGRRLSAWESAVVPENNWRGPFAPEMDQKLEEAFAEVKDSS